jgi:hypothetical protein
MLVCGPGIKFKHKIRSNSGVPRKEKALGGQMAFQVRSQTTSLGLVDVAKYIQTLGQRLAEQMPGPEKLAWH